MTSSDCAPADVLQRLLDGVLADGAAGPIRRHLPTCSSCQATLDRLSDDVELRRWKVAASVAGDFDMSGLLARLCETLPESCGTPTGDSDPSGVANAVLGPPAAEGELGTLGPYRVLGELGRGAMGVVYKAHDDALARVVALKVLTHGDEAARRRFVREARAAAMRSDCVIPIHAVSEPNAPVPFLVMESSCLPNQSSPKLHQRFTNRRPGREELRQIRGARILFEQCKPT
jgi:hypothetical protein